MYGVVPGMFLRSVLSNNLYDAIATANESELANLPEIVRYIYNTLPCSSYGSFAMMQAFVERKKGICENPNTEN